ncbi:hypothetical protein CASFOL_011830 [Castilleja foliolosa]|uniref:NAC domain-containing protein n=1 Tax=Castilleja foliolosa TaxID=1961234 RepID=A0ABD3DNN5_9LAMI
MEGLCSFITTDEPIELPPGFRFHPTDEELITHYLSPKVLNIDFNSIVVGEVDLNKVEPWDLPRKAKMGEKEWYFFCVRDKKYPTGSRTNRATNSGYWKATGKDKEIYRAKILVGMKKTLVFYRGRAPRGEKTNWVMHEYRLEGKKHSMHNNINFKISKNDWVICRIFNKSIEGKKVQISGLSRNINCGSNLPSLMDLSCVENHTRFAEGSHLNCFSNPIKNCSFDEFSSSSKNSDFPKVPYIFSQIPTQEIGVRTDVSSAISDHEVGFKPYADDQDFQMVSIGHADFDSLWNY